jgi:two-component system response regulator FixJ
MDGLVTGLSNKLIARPYDIGPRTIEVYRANVLTKMQARNLSELVRLALHTASRDPAQREETAHRIA